MADHNNNNLSNNDPTGEMISWAVVLILMFAFWPVGLVLLYRKLRGYAKPNGQASDRGYTQVTYQSQQTQHKTQHDYVRRQSANNAAEPARRTAEPVKRTAPQHTDYIKQARTEAYSELAREFSRNPAKKKKKKDRTPLEKKSGKFVSFILLLISITLFIIGANTMSGAARDIWGSGINSWRDLFMGAFYFIGAFISFFSRNIGVRKFSRYKKYYTFVAERGIVPISDIALASGQTSRVVRRDLQAMINDGYFGPVAYIDSELASLVLYPEAAQETRQAARGESSAAGAAQPQANEKPENQYMAIILELRELNDTISDIPISDKINRIEELTAKIFWIVEENPEKLPQIRRFMNYYLPTTLKLLRSYATLEKQGITGENITAAKANIGRILDTLATGYEQQLDQLFESDVIDIAADINVLENLMHQDGLTVEKPEMKVMEGAM